MTVTPIEVRLFSLAEAADRTPYSEQTIRRAVKKVRDDGSFPHPMHSKRGSKGEYLIPSTSLQTWIDNLPDS